MRPQPCRARATPELSEVAGRALAGPSAFSAAFFFFFFKISTAGRGLSEAAYTLREEMWLTEQMSGGPNTPGRLGQTSVDVPEL